MRKPHKWYRIEMTATGQVYAREVAWPADDGVSVGLWTEGNLLVASNVGRYTCTCCKRYS
jgi:hypothetical protein